MYLRQLAIDIDQDNFQDIEDRFIFIVHSNKFKTEKHYVSINDKENERYTARFSVIKRLK